MNILELTLHGMLKTHKVDKSRPAALRPWRFKHRPQVGAIDAHEINASDGTFVGVVYSYADAKLICDLVNNAVRK